VLLKKWKYKVYYQVHEKECGITCLRIVARYYKKRLSLSYLRSIDSKSFDGTKINNLAETAGRIGFTSFPIETSVNDLKQKVIFPCILHWNENHYVVLFEVIGNNFLIGDPIRGLYTVGERKFKRQWIKMNRGIALVLYPNSSFKTIKEDGDKRKTRSFIFGEVISVKKSLFHAFLLTIIAGIFSTFLPITTQMLIDTGVGKRNIEIVNLLLIGQIALFLGLVVSNIFRNWTTLYINSKLTTSIISKFLKKLLQLPTGFFENRTVGDIYQRVYDQRKIENFISSTSPSAIYSFFVIIFSLTLVFYYNHLISVVLLAGVVFSMLWSLAFNKKIKINNIDRFNYQQKHHNIISELIRGVLEIKKENEQAKRNHEWSLVQNRIIKASIDNLKIEQEQEIGVSMTNQLINILILFLSAKLVINETISLGMLVGISAIVSQINSRIPFITNWIKGLADFRLTCSRLNDIYETDVEYSGSTTITRNNFGSIFFNNLSFRYPFSDEYVLRNINLEIPRGRCTAIVGDSGSGKTTLLKLLLKFYDPTEGQITLGNTDFRDLNVEQWRDACGAVLQSSFIFSESLKNNISSSRKFDIERYQRSIQMANLLDLESALPLRSETRIGDSGMEISGGERQRVLIAKLIYKNPEYVFLDESTSALDAKNESQIMNNIRSLFIDRTILIIAHRLSTIINADNIIVMSKGKVVESGTHEELMARESYYQSLILSQVSQ
jgi:ATP-binding cassette subfamily B protein